MTDDWKDAAGDHSVCFIVQFSVYKFRSLGALDAIKRNVFSLESL